MLFIIRHICLLHTSVFILKNDALFFSFNQDFSTFISNLPNYGKSLNFCQLARLQRLQNNFSQYFLLIILLSYDISPNPGPDSANLNCLRVGSWNINSLSKDSWAPIDKLRLKYSKDVDVLALQETKLNHSIPDSTINLNGFHLYQKEYTRKSSGLAIYVRQSYLAKIFHLPELFLLHVLAVKVILSNCSLITVNVYRRPVAPDDKVKDQLHTLYNSLSATNCRVILLGDFNIDMSFENNLKKGQQMKNFLLTTGLNNLSLSPT